MTWQRHPNTVFLLNYLAQREVCEPAEVDQLAQSSTIRVADLSQRSNTAAINGIPGSVELLNPNLV